MKNEIKAISPASAGLSLVVISGPRPFVWDGNPSIQYTVQLLGIRRQTVWQGEYQLGVGHVKPLSYDDFSRAAIRWNPHLKLTPNEENMSHHWARGVRFASTPENAQLQASLASKLAAFQKVTPKLEDVCASLLLDGSAFFDGERFEEWAANFGYSSDSIKAKETFEACDKTGRELSRHLSRDQIDGLREWASNY